MLLSIITASAGRTRLVSCTVCPDSTFPKKTMIEFGSALRSVLSAGRMSSVVPRAAEASAAFSLQVVGGNRGAAKAGGDQRLGKNHRCDRGDRANCGESSFPHTCLWWGQGLCFGPRSQLHELALGEDAVLFLSKERLWFLEQCLQLKMSNPFISMRCGSLTV